MKKIILSIFVFWIFGFCFFNDISLADSESRIIINELIPNPEGLDTNFEWIELFNASTDQINLKDWTIDGKKVGEDFFIQPQGYIIVAKNEQALLERYPQLNANSVLQLAISLKNSDDSVEILDENEIVIDTVSYQTTSEGKSLERKGILDIEDCNILVQHQDSNTIGTKNENYDELCWENDILINKIRFSLNGISYLDNMNTTGPIEIFLSFYTNDSSKLISSEKYFLENGTEISNPQELDEYSGRIRALVTFVDGTSLSVWSEPILIKAAPNYTGLVFSEIHPSPKTGESEWIELYNDSKKTVDLTLLMLKRENCNGDIVVENFPVATLNPKQFFVLEGKVLKKNLLNAGGKLMLCDEKNSSVTDIIYPKIATGLSFIRKFQGNEMTSTTEITEIPTKGFVNISTNFNEEEPDEIEDDDDDETSQPNVPAKKKESSSVNGKVSSTGSGSIIQSESITYKGKLPQLETAEIDTTKYYKLNNGIHKPTLHQGINLTNIFTAYPIWIILLFCCVVTTLLLLWKNKFIFLSLWTDVKLELKNLEQNEKYFKRRGNPVNPYPLKK